MHARLSLWKNALLEFGEPARFAIMLAFRRRRARMPFRLATAALLRTTSETVARPSRAETQLRQLVQTAVLLTVKTCTSLTQRRLLLYSAVAEPPIRYPPGRPVKARDLRPSLIPYARTTALHEQ